MASSGPSPALAVDTHFIAATDDPSLRLHLRNKRPAGVDRFDADHVLLFVHGATYPSETGFDQPLPGGSWMDYVATRGYDAWCLDVRGYGRSSRPAAMHAPAADHAPVADTADAIRDIAAAVAFIRARRRIAQLVLIGWSWGTTTTAGFTAAHGEQVRRLVLYAPLWLLEGHVPPVAGTGAWREVDRTSARARAVAGIPPDRIEAIWPQAWFDDWWRANLATDPIGSAANPPVLRTPNGVVKDVVEHWARGHPMYDPADIRVPTLVVGAEWDRDTPPAMARAVHARLVNAPRRELVVLPEGTHSIVLETGRMALLETVQRFLDARD